MGHLGFAFRFHRAAGARFLYDTVGVLGLLVLALTLRAEETRPAATEKGQHEEQLQAVGDVTGQGDETAKPAEASTEAVKPKGPAASAERQPKALRIPVNLVPVQDAAEVPASKPAAPRSTPPIRLVPEPLSLHAERAEPASQDVEGIRPASFKEISPGKSTRDDVIKQLGDPLETTASDEKQELVFKLGPFPSVRITMRDGLVSSIVVHLAAPTARGNVVKDLHLVEFEPAVIRDEANRGLGEVYPERGLILAYQGTGEVEGSDEENVAPAERKIGHVVLERISVEPFLLRVEQTPEQQINKRLKDLRTVQQLAPDVAEAYARAARLDRRCGRLTAASQAANKALAIDPENTGYRILNADIDRLLGHRQESLQVIRDILSDDSISLLEEAESQLILGRLLATGSRHDYEQGMRETVTAIKRAAKETGVSSPGRRRRARELLIRAQLSLAEILSYGHWKQKHEVVPKWLASAEQVTNEYLEKDDAPRDVLLDLYNTSLHCLLVLDGQGAPTDIAEAAIRLGRDLIAESEDIDYQSLVEWKLGTAIWRAAQVEQQQGNTDQALRFADNAEALMSTALKARQDSPNARHQLAQLRFLLGSIHAIHKRDHDLAMYWYDKAKTHLTTPYPDSLLDNRGPVGDQLVSIGISLWETDRRNQAVSVTREGITLISNAVEAGTFKPVSLAVPYSNLEAMYRELGKDAEAEKMAQKASKYQPSSPSEEILR